jgi:flagellar motor protein MotB
MQRYRKHFLFTAIFIVLAAVSIVAMPFGIQYALVSWLEGDNPGSATIENVDFNPFTGSLLIEDLSVQEKTGRRLKLQHVSLNLEISKLFTKRIQLRSLEMHDSHLDVLQTKTGSFQLAGLPQQTQSKPSPDSQSRWQFGADDITIKNTRIRFHRPRGQEEFSLKTLQAGNIVPWQPGASAKIDALLGLHNASVKISAKAFPFSNAPSLTATLKIKSLDMARLKKFSLNTELKGIDGVVSGALDVLVKFQKNKKASEGAETSLNLAGNIRIDGLKIGNDRLMSAPKSTQKDTKPQSLPEPIGEKTAAPFSAQRVSVSKLSAKITRSNIGDIKLAATAQMILEKLKVTTAEAELRNEEIRWAGNLNASLNSAGKLTTRATGTINSRLLDLNLPVSALKVSQKLARWNGQIEFRQESHSAKPTLNFKGSAESQDVQVDSPDLGVRLMRLGSLKIDDAEAKGLDNIHLRQVTAQKLETIQRIPTSAKRKPGQKPYVAFRGALTADDLSIKNGTDVSLRHLLLDGADLQIERLKNGELRLVGSLLSQIGRWSAARKKDKPQATKAFSMRIKKWTTAGKSRLVLADRSVKPAAKFVISPIRIELKNIDTDKPGANIPIEISAKPGKYSTLNVKGFFRPFTDRLNLHVSGNLTGFNLTSVSGYSRRYTGYDLTQGRLDTKIDARIIDGKLQANSVLKISKLQMRPADPKVLNPLETRLEIPLETGLALLRDGEDIIHLNVPVTGDIANPKFDFSDAFNTAFGNAIKKTILTTLKVLFPLGGIIKAVAESDGKTALQLNPLLFALGSAELSASTTTNLAKIADLLKLRPTAKISICGRAVPGDVSTSNDALKAVQSKESENSDVAKTSPQDQMSDAARTALLELAKQRATMVKDHLIKQHDIPEARLFLCAPKLSDPANAKPPVEIHF